MAAPLPPRLDAERPPSDDESRLLKRLKELREEGEDCRKRWAPTQDQEDYLKLYRDAGTPPPSRGTYFKGNFIAAFVDRSVDKLTDNRPITRVEERKAGLHKVALVLTRATTALWEEQRVQRQTYKMCHKAGICGSAGMFTGYDSETGDIVLEVLSLDQVACDPAVTEAAMLHEAEYISVESVKAVEYVKTRFARGSLVKPDVSLVEGPGEAKRRTLTGPVVDMLRGAKGFRDAVDRVRVYRMLVRDRQRDPKTLRPMFPSGRMIFHTDDVVLWDGPLPYWDGAWPVDWFDWTVDPEHLWGSSMPKLLRYLQLAFNQLGDGLVENQLLSNFLTIIGDWDSIAPEAWKKLENISASIILRKKNRNAMAPSVTPPPPFGADKVALLRWLFQMAQLLSGVTDVTLGGDTGSLQSGLAIEGLQEGANLANRSRASRLEDFFSRVGQKLVARTFQFWPADRMIHLLGPTGDAIDYAIKRSEFFVTDDGQEFVTDEDRMRALRDLRFMVVPGSSAPGSRARRAQTMADLMKVGLASGKDVLEVAGFQNPDEMLERAKAWFKEMGQFMPTQGSSAKAPPMAL